VRLGCYGVCVVRVNSDLPGTMVMTRHNESDESSQSKRPKGTLMPGFDFGESVDETACDESSHPESGTINAAETWDEPLPMDTSAGTSGGQGPAGTDSSPAIVADEQTADAGRPAQSADPTGATRPGSTSGSKVVTDGPEVSEQDADDTRSFGRSTQFEIPAGPVVGSDVYSQTISYRTISDGSDDDEFEHWQSVLEGLRRQKSEEDPFGVSDESEEGSLYDSTLPPGENNWDPGASMRSRAASSQWTDLGVLGDVGSLDELESPDASDTGDGLGAPGVPNDTSHEYLAATQEGTLVEPTNQTETTAEGASQDSALRIRRRPITGAPFGTHRDPDYKVVNRLAEGGMGVVYEARQTSLNRDLALKTLKPMSQKAIRRLKRANRFETMQRQRREMFLSEAVVTANLVHPNIVPIHDLGVTEDDMPFYSMKRVVGTPWNERIADMTLEENLDVLLKVADAVAYAHHKGVLNRDLKPENVMLGEFGEVVVLDWGLSIPAPGSDNEDVSLSATSLGQGTPYYMAPEMILGPVERLGKWSDIYLLGAILFEILTDAPPHEFKSPKGRGIDAVHFQIAEVVGNNRIREVKETGELMDIARLALATNPGRRHRTVKEFQLAINEARQHEESLTLTDRANNLLTGDPDYAKLQNAITLFDEAQREWSENSRALVGEHKARLQCAEKALEQGDHDFGLAMLPEKPGTSDSDAMDAEFESMRSQLRQGRVQRLEADRKKREAEEKKQEADRAKRRALKFLVAALLVIVVGGAAGLYSIDQGRQALEAKNHENETLIGNLDVAKETIATADESAKKLIADATRDADAAKTIAETEAEEAQIAKAKAEADAKVAQSAVAKAKADALEAEANAKLALAAATKAEADAKLAQTAVAKANADVKEAEANVKLAQIAATKARADTTKAEADAKLAQTAVAKAETDAKEAQKAKAQAVADAKLAQTAKAKAEADAKLADKQVEEALAAAARAEIEGVYKATVAQANGQLRVGEYEPAIRLLEAALKTDISNARKDVIQRKLNQARDGLRETRQPVKTSAVSRDGRTVVVGDAKGTVSVWRVDAGAEELPEATTATFTLPNNRAVEFVSTTPDGLKVFVAAQKTVYVGDTASGDDAALTVFAELNQKVTAMNISPDGEWLVTGERDGFVRVIDPRSGKRLGRYEADKPIQDLVVVPGKSRLIVLTSDQCLLVKATVKPSLSLKFEYQAPIDPTISLSRVAIAPDGKTLVVSQNGRGNVLVLRLSGTADSGRLVRESNSRVHASPVTALNFSVDGTRLLTASKDYTVGVWDVSDPDVGLPETPIHRLMGHGDPVIGCEFVLKSAERLVSMSGQGSLRFWNLARYERERELLRDGIIEKPPGDAARPVSSTNAATWTLDRKPTHTRRLLSVRNRAQTVRAAPSVFRPVLFQNTPNESDRCNKTRCVISRHIGAVNCVRLSHDGQRLMTAGEDRRARVSSAATGAPATTPESLPLEFQADPAFEEGHRFNVSGIQFVPVGENADLPDHLVLTTGFDATLSLWNADLQGRGGAGHQLARIRNIGLLNAVAVSKDGEWILTTVSEPRENSDTNRVYGARLWKTSELVKPPELANSSTPGLELELISNRRGFQVAVSAVAISPGNDVFATGTRRGQVALWDRTGSVIATVPGAHGTATVTAIEFLSDTRLVSSGVDGEILDWKIETEPSVRLVSQPRFDTGSADETGAITQLALSPDRSQFLTVTFGTESLQTLHLWDVTQPDQRKEIPLDKIVLDTNADEATNQSNTEITSIGWSSDGNRFIVVADHILRVFQAPDWENPKWLLADTTRRSEPTAAAFPPEPGLPGHVVTFDGFTAHQWKLRRNAAGVPLGQHQRSFRPHATIFSADFSGDGKFVVTGSRMVRIFNADPNGKSYGRSLYNLQTPHVVSCVAFSPEIGRYRFLAANRDGTAKIWEWFPEDDKVTEVAALTGHKGVIRHAVWSPQGDRLLTVGADDTPRIWTEQAGKMVSTELPVNQEVDYDFVCGAFSADGKWVAAGASSNASDGIIGWVWKVDGNSFRQHSSITESPEGLMAVGFVPGVDPGTQRLVTGSGNGAVTVWNVPRGFGANDPNVLLDNIALPAWDGEAGGAAHRGSVTSIDTSPDGTIVSASEDGTAVIWLDYRKKPANADGPAAVGGGDGI